MFHPYGNMYPQFGNPQGYPQQQPQGYPQQPGYPQQYPGYGQPGYPQQQMQAPAAANAAYTQTSRDASPYSNAVAGVRPANAGRFQKRENFVKAKVRKKQTATVAMRPRLARILRAHSHSPVRDALS